jgi:hypothetical protein
VAKEGKKRNFGESPKFTTGFFGMDHGKAGKKNRKKTVSRGEEAKYKSFAILPRKDPTSTDLTGRRGKKKEKKLPHVEKEGKNISLAMISSKELISLFKERDFFGITGKRAREKKFGNKMCQRKRR